MKTKDNMTLPLYIGTDSSNKSYYIDMTNAPHILMAGKTGSGKSVCLHSIIMSLIRTKTPDELRLMLIDPKMVEFSVYNKIANQYLIPYADHSGVITQPEEALKAICNLLAEVDKRFDMLREARVRDIDEYNRNNTNTKLPYIILIIDEFADFMIKSRIAFEHLIGSIACVSRCVGVHIIMSTQRPQYDIITAIFKAFFPYRIAFKVTTDRESKIILDRAGANNIVNTGICIVSNGSSFNDINCTMVPYKEVVSFCKKVEAEISSTVYILPEGDMPKIEEEVEDENINYNETLELLIECSAAEYCTPATTLDELGIDPIGVLKSLLCNHVLELNGAWSDFELSSQDNHAVIFTQSIFKFKNPISEITTLGKLANELTQISDNVDRSAYDTNVFDLIETTERSNTKNGWFTEDTSWGYSNVNASEFIRTIKEIYGVQIEKKAITGFNGSVRELCESLTDRINRALAFQRKKDLD